MPVTVKFLDLVHRASVVALVGTGVWGLWLTAAVYKSRRGDGAIQGVLSPSEQQAAKQAELLQAARSRMASTSTNSNEGSGESEESLSSRQVTAAPPPRTRMAGPRGILQQGAQARRQAGQHNDGIEKTV
ncbi:hypothetical protein CBOM_00429 [Ceraceosorus bombacis]|uniref:Uncharacterized protein n=1 Tax=Ceraceosorus bombacis TaxID=401625 RepID=A0A0P1B9I0_9BASI|nr:hypothetical protein CBOM_00429 [Ceraceosorus bombacis]